MTIGPHVFGDNRLGLWIINPQNLAGRLPSIKAFAGGQVTDLFLPRDAQPSHMHAVRQAGLFAHLYTIPHGRTAAAYAKDTLADVDRLGPGALELNVEIPDEQISAYVTTVIGKIRAQKRSLRMRLNIAPFKARFLPHSLINADPHIYVIEQAYFGNMDGRASEEDVRRDLNAFFPEEKGSVMYAAHCSPEPGKARVPSLPSLAHRRLYRGSIYQDDLMVNAGYL